MSSKTSTKAIATLSNRTRCFSGFPKRTLLEKGKIPIERLAELALREGQYTKPIYRVHRWFARRLGSQFRSILTGLILSEDEADQFGDTYLGDISLKGVLVLDPFVGGGTSLVESLRCNANVIGYDIDPVATFITNFELSLGNCNLDASLIRDTCASVSETVSKFHMTHVSGLGICDVLHHFWVELRICNNCGHKIEVHPHYQLAYSTEKDKQWVFCKECHKIHELPLERKELLCDCRVRTRISRGTIIKGKLRCSQCGFLSKLSSYDNRPEWYLFAQEYIDRSSGELGRRFKAATKGDRIRYGKASRMLYNLEKYNGPFAPERDIPLLGRSDQRPIIHGFKRYRDLFNDRQLLHLTLLGKAIASISDESVKRALAIAFSEHLTTNCMYTAYAFGYRRTSPLFSIHSYRHITRPVEINPWLNGIGRGTFPNTLNKLRKAVEFATSPTELDPQGGYQLNSSACNLYKVTVGRNPTDVLNGNCTAAVKTQSSEELTDIPDGVIDLILTDPPYFDNISYSELSDFYLAWHQKIGVSEPPYNNAESVAPIFDNIAVVDKSEEALLMYRNKLLRIFSECRRVLKSKGICVFTYHHRSTIAWCAVGEALALSGFKCTSVLPLRGEGQGGLHSHNGTIKWDAVFICRKTEEFLLFNPNDQVVVSKEKLLKAKSKAKAYVDRLTQNKRIGFREPDFHNLERAFIVSVAVVDSMDNTKLLLKAALNTTK